MANFVIDTAPVTTGMFDMLVAALAPQKVGRGIAPDGLVRDAQGRLVEPYAILYAVTSPVFAGSMAHPEEMASLSFQVTSVGGNDRSALVMRDRVSRAVVGRTTTGLFERAMATGATVSVIDRKIFQYGTPEAVQDLWQVPDTFTLEVQAHG